MTNNTPYQLNQQTKDITLEEQYGLNRCRSSFLSVNF